MRYKALKYFKTTQAYQDYLRKGGQILDSVNIGGIDFTMHEYDINGFNISYANKRTKKMFEVDTPDNRYKNGFRNASLTDIFEAIYLRNDIVYLD